MNPWHAECNYCGAWLVPPRVTMCAECEAKWNAGARMADREWAKAAHELPGWRGDTDTSGAPLHGPSSREAIHKAHQSAIKEKDE